MKSEFHIKRGTHYSDGRKPQPLLFPVLGVVLAALLLVLFAWSEWAILSAFVLVCVAWNAHANEMIDSHTMKMRVMFWDNCLYRLEPPHDKDINKLYLCI